MTHSAPSDETVEAVAGRCLYDDNGDAIGPREHCVDDGLVASADDGLVQALAILTPAEIAEALANRVVIEQALGMLVFVYWIASDEAHELLRWRAHTAGVSLRRFAAQLATELVGVSQRDHASLRKVWNDLLLDLPERIGPSQ